MGLRRIQRRRPKCHQRPSALFKLFVQPLPVFIICHNPVGRVYYGVFNCRTGAILSVSDNLITTTMQMRTKKLSTTKTRDHEKPLTEGRNGKLNGCNQTMDQATFKNDHGRLTVTVINLITQYF